MKLSRFHLILLSIAVAILSIFLLFPLSYLMGIGLYWENPASEVNIALATLRYYVSEPLWFPIGFIESINVPEGTNILYGSSVPLFSFLAKVLNQTSGININSILKPKASYIWQSTRSIAINCFQFINEHSQ